MTKPHQPHPPTHPPTLPPEHPLAWLTPLTNALETGVASVYGLPITDAWSQEAYDARLQSLGYRTLCLRPSVPWAPLAPLQQLYQAWELPWPDLTQNISPPPQIPAHAVHTVHAAHTTNALHGAHATKTTKAGSQDVVAQDADNPSDDLGANPTSLKPGVQDAGHALLPLLWLGHSVVTSSMFMQLALQLRDCPTIVWLASNDLTQPIWGDLLRAASQGQLAMPISFLCRVTDAQPAPVGVTSLHPRGTPPSVTPSPSISLPQRTANYLAQVLLFGPQWQPKVMAYISRANQEHHRDVLRRAGLLVAAPPGGSHNGTGRVVHGDGHQKADSDIPVERQDTDTEAEHHPGQEYLALDRLYQVTLGTLPQSQRWRRRALSQLPPDIRFDTVRWWLRLSPTPMTSPNIQGRLDRHRTHQDLIALLQLAWDGWKLQDNTGQRGLSDELQCCVALIQMQTPETQGPLELAVAAPYAQLYQARHAPLQSIEGCHLLQSLYEQLIASGPAWAAALVALDLVRWQQALGQEKRTFGLLAPFAEETHWAIQWRRWLLLAEAYRRMGRLDMAQHALGQATAAAPKPLSPVLAGELRLTAALFHSASGDRDAAKQQRDVAKDTFRAMGDGMRLGRQLCALADDCRQRQMWDQAKALYAQALGISRRFRDGIGAQEAEIKLGLLRQQMSRT